MSSQDTIPANTDKPCACCKRIHRTLHLVGGYWLGKNCAEQYKLYRRDNNINSLTWRGYEKKHAQLTAMVKGQNPLDGKSLLLVQ